MYHKECGGTIKGRKYREGESWFLKLTCRRCNQKVNVRSYFLERIFNVAKRKFGLEVSYYFKDDSHICDYSKDEAYVKVERMKEEETKKIYERWKEAVAVNNLAKEAKEIRNLEKEKYKSRYNLHDKIERICKEFAEKLGGGCSGNKITGDDSFYQLKISSFKIGWKTKSWHNVEVIIYYGSLDIVKIETEYCTESLQSKCTASVSSRGVHYNTTYKEKSSDYVYLKARCSMPIKKFSEQIFTEVLGEFCKETMALGASKFYRYKRS